MFVSLLVKVTPKGEAKLELLWKKWGKTFLSETDPIFCIGLIWQVALNVRCGDKRPETQIFLRS
jgi:hypothetical protein